MPLIDLSHTIRTGMAQFPGDAPPPRIVRRLTHEADGHLVSALDFGCHVGTHIDTPAHFLAGRPGLEALPLDDFHGPALVVDAGEGEIREACLAGVDLAGLDFLLLRTGWARHWGGPRYYRDWPYLSPALARRLAAAGLKGVGLDTPSLDPLGGGQAHEICAAAGMINIENLTNLAALPAGRFILLVLPLKLEGTEGSPVRAAAWIAARAEEGP